MGFHGLLLFFLLPLSAAPSLISSSISSFSMEAVKAFTAVGPDVFYLREFSSLELDSPLIFLDLSDDKACPDCCKVMATGQPCATLTSLASSRTVVVSTKSLNQCPDGKSHFGLESFFMGLVRAGASAVILVSPQNTPGLLSNIVGCGPSEDRLAARASVVPFVAVGAEGGEMLIQAIQHPPPPPPPTSPPTSPPPTPTPPPPNFHVTFKYDSNSYLDMYQNFKFPLLFASLSAFALIAHRFLNLGLRLNPSTHLPVLTTTRNYIALMALPTLLSIVTMVSTNSTMVFGEGSKLWVLYSACQMCPFLNLSSSVLVARFWSAHAGSLGSTNGSSSTAATSRDPATSHPVATFLIVFVGLFADVFAAFYTVFSPERDPEEILPFLYLPMFAGYVLTTFYFFCSGVKLLRSLSSLSRPLRTMSLYLLLTATFMFMTSLALFTIGSGNYYALSAEEFFLNVVLFYGGSYGCSICHLFIFSTSIDSAAVTVGYDETFLETEFRALEQENAAQNQTIVQLQEEKDGIMNRSTLEARLIATGHQAELRKTEHQAELRATEHQAELRATEHQAELRATGHQAELRATEHQAELRATGHQAELRANEHQAELNSQMLEAETRVRLNAQTEKSSFLAAIHGEKERERRENERRRVCIVHFPLPSSFHFSSLAMF